MFPAVREAEGPTRGNVALPHSVDFGAKVTTQTLKDVPFFLILRRQFCLFLASFPLGDICGTVAGSRRGGCAAAPAGLLVTVAATPEPRGAALQWRLLRSASRGA